MRTARLIASLPKGQFTKADVRFMLNILPLVNNTKGAYLEVGSLLGRSSTLIGYAARDVGEKLFCIDIWDKGEWTTARRKPPMPADPHRAFMDNMKARGLGPTLVSIRGKSRNIVKGWKKALRFVHIDGAHDYISVLTDTGWKKYVSPGGIICFHDYCKAAVGVTRAVDDELGRDENFEKIGIRHSLIAFRKRG